MMSLVSILSFALVASAKDPLANDHVSNLAVPISLTPKIDPVDLNKASDDECTNTKGYLEPIFTKIRVVNENEQKECPVDQNATQPVDAAREEFIRKLLTQEVKSKLPQSCIEAAMKTMPADGDAVAYGQCGSTNTVSKVNPNCDHAKASCPVNDRPCLSPNYKSFVYNSFVEAMKCVGLEVQEMYPLFALESGFHVNIGSATGAWGAAQLTDIGIGEVNRTNDVEKLSKKPACADIANFMQEPLPDAHKHWKTRTKPGTEGYKIRQSAICESITPPTSPLKSFIYGALLYQSNKRAARSLVKMWPNLELTGAERDTIALELTRYMYNGGRSGISQAFQAFIEEEGNDKLPADQFVDKFSEYLKANYARSGDESKATAEKLKDRRSEVSSYTNALRKKLGVIHSISGGAKCGKSA